MSSLDNCTTCRREVGWATPLCVCCGRSVCLSCAEQTEIGVMCPACASNMAAFLAEGEVTHAGQPPEVSPEREIEF